MSFAVRLSLLATIVALGALPALGVAIWAAQAAGASMVESRQAYAAYSANADLVMALSRAAGAVCALEAARRPAERADAAEAIDEALAAVEQAGLTLKDTPPLRLVARLAAVRDRLAETVNAVRTASPVRLREAGTPSLADELVALGERFHARALGNGADGMRALSAAGAQVASIPTNALVLAAVGLVAAVGASAAAARQWVLRPLDHVRKAALQVAERERASDAAPIMDLTRKDALGDIARALKAIAAEGSAARRHQRLALRLPARPQLPLAASGSPHTVPPHAAIQHGVHHGGLRNDGLTAGIRSA